MINYYSIFGLVARVITLSILILYVIPIQIGEVRRPKDVITPYRWAILVLIIAYCFTSLPSIAFQATRVTGSVTLLTLQNFATVSGNLANLIVGSVFYFIYNYKDKSDE